MFCGSGYDIIPINYTGFYNPYIEFFLFLNTSVVVVVRFNVSMLSIPPIILISVHLKRRLIWFLTSLAEKCQERLLEKFNKTLQNWHPNLTSKTSKNLDRILKLFDLRKGKDKRIVLMAHSWSRCKKQILEWHSYAMLCWNQALSLVVLSPCSTTLKS